MDVFVGRQSVWKSNGDCHFLSNKKQDHISNTGTNNIFLKYKYEKHVNPARTRQKQVQGGLAITDNWLYKLFWVTKFWKYKKTKNTIFLSSNSSSNFELDTTKLDLWNAIK